MAFSDENSLGKKYKVKAALACSSAEVIAWYVAVALVTLALVAADEGIKAEMLHSDTGAFSKSHSRGVVTSE